MVVHQLRLATKPFESIKNGKKVIESRLFDKKRQMIRPGDEIIFENREKPDDRVKAKVIGLLRYQTFHDLFSCNNYHKFDGDSVEYLENQINEFYTLEQQMELGVVGIEFELCDG